MEISDHADTQDVHLFSDSDHDHFIDWEDDDILGRLLRVPEGCFCGKKLPTLIRSSMVFYTCIAASNECPSYISSSDGAAKHSIQAATNSCRVTISQGSLTWLLRGELLSML